MPQETLSQQELLTARYVHLWLNTALEEMRRQNPGDAFTIPTVVLGCREFLAEVLARVSAQHHTPGQATKAFAGFTRALDQSTRRNTKLLRDGKDGAELSWLPGA